MLNLTLLLLKGFLYYLTLLTKANESIWKNAVLETLETQGMLPSRKIFTALDSSICLDLFSTISSNNTGVLTDHDWGQRSPGADEGWTPMGEIPEVRKLGRGTERHVLWEVQLLFNGWRYWHFRVCQGVMMRWKIKIKQGSKVRTAQGRRQDRSRTSLVVQCPYTFDPCSGKTPHTTGATTREATATGSPCTATKSRPCSLQLEEAHTQQWRSRAAKSK